MCVSLFIMVAIPGDARTVLVCWLLLEFLSLFLSFSLSHPVPPFPSVPSLFSSISFPHLLLMTKEEKSDKPDPNRI